MRLFHRHYAGRLSGTWHGARQRFVEGDQVDVARIRQHPEQVELGRRRRHRLGLLLLVAMNKRRKAELAYGVAFLESTSQVCHASPVVQSFLKLVAIERLARGVGRR